MARSLLQILVGLFDGKPQRGGVFFLYLFSCGIEKTNIERRGLVPRCLLLGNAMLHGASHTHACDAVVLGKLFTEVLVGSMHVLVDIHFRFDFRKLLRKVDGIGAIDDGTNELFGFVGRDERLPASIVTIHGDYLAQPSQREYDGS